MRHILICLVALSLVCLGCSRNKVKTEPEVRLSIEPSGYFWLNLMPPVPPEGPSLRAIFKIKIVNVGKSTAKNTVAVAADIVKISDDGEEKLTTLELEPSPGTPVENELLPGESMTVEYGGSFGGATEVTPGLKVYGKVFVAWLGGDTTAVTPTEEVISTR